MNKSIIIVHDNRWSVEKRTGMIVSKEIWKNNNIQIKIFFSFMLVWKPGACAYCFNRYRMGKQIIIRIQLNNNNMVDFQILNQLCILRINYWLCIICSSGVAFDLLKFIHYLLLCLYLYGILSCNFLFRSFTSFGIRVKLVLWNQIFLQCRNLRNIKLFKNDKIGSFTYVFEM